MVSEIGFGAWAIGGTWGEVNDDESRKALREAVENGINFFDTADVYGDGRSERLVGELKKDYGDQIHIATKAGRRLNPHTAEGLCLNILNIICTVDIPLYSEAFMASSTFSTLTP